MAFETSCDETSVAVLKNDTELLSNVIASKLKAINASGEFPEVASRHHVEAQACIEEALEAGITEEVTAVAVTYGPGLVELFWSVLCSQGLCLGPWDSFDSCQSYGRALDGRSKR
ncbi:MAG: hypothetical protein ACLRSL_05170 [Streptococcus sp.]